MIHLKCQILFSLKKKNENAVCIFAWHFIKVQSFFLDWENTQEWSGYWCDDWWIGRCKGQRLWCFLSSWLWMRDRGLIILGDRRIIIAPIDLWVEIEKELFKIQQVAFHVACGNNIIDQCHCHFLSFFFHFCLPDIDKLHGAQLLSVFTLDNGTPLLLAMR